MEASSKKSPWVRTWKEGLGRGQRARKMIAWSPAERVPATRSKMLKLVAALSWVILSQPPPQRIRSRNATAWSRTASVIFRKQTYVILKPKELQKLGLDTPTCHASGHGSVTDGESKHHLSSAKSRRGASLRKEFLPWAPWILSPALPLAFCCPLG